MIGRRIQNSAGRGGWGRSVRVLAGLVVVLGLVSPLWAIRGVATDEAAVAPRNARPLAPVAGVRAEAVEQRRARAKALDGIHVSWDAQRGVPALVTGEDLRPAAGARQRPVQGLSADERGVAEAVEVMSALAPLYGMHDAASELRALRSHVDRTGYRHVRLQQLHRGVRVVGATPTVHFDEAGRCRTVNGRFIPDLGLPVEPRFAGATAEAIAQRDARERGLDQVRVGIPAELVVWARGNEPVLGYLLTLHYAHANGGTGEWRYLVDAVEGTIRLRFDNRQDIAAPGPAGTHEPITGVKLSGEGGGAVSVTGWRDTGTGAWYLWNWANRWGLKNAASSGWPDAGTYVHRFSSDWGVSDPAAISLARNFNTTLTYYRDVHGRDGFDGAGVRAIANLHLGYNYVNAFWSPAAQEFSFGDGDGVSAGPLTVLDVAAHEFHHAVTEYTCDLIYQGESGALNESVSDIFGALVEFHAQPDGRAAYPNATAGHADWLMGEDAWLSDVALRDMANPLRYDQPSRYMGTDWFDTSSWADNGGVHYNSGVQNFFFYLLCEGGVGNNDGIDYDVAGIGTEAGAKLAYLVQTAYLTPSSDYAAAREAWVAAAIQADSSGLTTGTVYAAVAAWAAVGIGSFAEVLPDEPFVTGGEKETGVFLPASKLYVVMNYRGVPETWRVSVNHPVFTLSESEFTLAPYSSRSVVISVDTNVAVTLDDGVYTGLVKFDNVYRTFRSTTRSAYLRVGQSYTVRSHAFDWIDPVASVHGAVPMSGGVSPAYTLPFTLSVFGVEYSSIYICERGVIGLVPDGLPPGENTQMPDPAAPNGMLAPYWDDLAALQGGRVYQGLVGQYPDRYRVITWLNMGHREDPSANYSFQVLIREAPSTFGDNDIRFQYLEVASDHPTLGNGRSATIGVESDDGLLGRQYSRDGETLVADRQALLFTMLAPEDTTAPSGRLAVAEEAPGSVKIRIRFSEWVTGLELDDLEFTSSIPGATLEAFEGSGELYHVTVGNMQGLGSVALSVRAGAVEDLVGLPNEAFGPLVYVVPLERELFADNLELGSFNWTASAGSYPGITENGWEWGTPASPGFGPPYVPSGSNYWGTVIDDLYLDDMNATISSIPVVVGARPVLSFKLWYGLEPLYDYGYVEVNNGSGWHPVGPAGGYTGFSDSWEDVRLELDPELFGNRQLQIRFRVISDTYVTLEGMYVDDVRLASLRRPGVWVQHMEPQVAAPDTSRQLLFTAYNTSTSTYHDVVAVVDSLNPAATISGTTTVSYGDIPPGGLVTGTPVTALFGSAAQFDSPSIPFTHAVYAGGTLLGEEFVRVAITGLPGITTSKRLAAVTTRSVVDWLGEPLQGNGSLDACLFQVVYAGADGTIDPPGSNGASTGDDRILYVLDGVTPHGRFGAGAMVPADFGQFAETFRHGLPGGSVYVRAWDGSGYASSLAYGESLLKTLTSATEQTIDFGTWTVGTPIDYTRDLNGDTVPDGYDVLRGADARVPVQPLETDWTSIGQVGGTAGAGVEQLNRPGRVVQWGDYLFVADTRNSRIQTWSADLGTHLASYGSQGSANGQFNWPEGLDLDAASRRLVVADTKNNRIVVLQIDPDTAALSFVMAFGTVGSTAGQFQGPHAVAVDAGGGMVVADSGNDRIQSFDSAGGWRWTSGERGSEPGQFINPRGVCVDGSGNLLVVDTANHRIQVLASDGVAFDLFGVGELSGPTDIRVGPGGRLFVADSVNHRIQLYAPDYTLQASFKPPSGEMGAAPGQLFLPQGVWPRMDSGRLYVADTGNHRVQLLQLAYDADQDGMDDIWEDANGLDPSDPTDAAADFDGDGVSNIGEFRAETDPWLRDSNGDGLSDGYSMEVPIDPNGYFPPHAGVRIDAAGMAAPVSDVLAWEAEAGAVYKVELSLDLPQTEWIPQATVTVSEAGTVMWTNAVPPVVPRHFYRIRREL